MFGRQTAGVAENHPFLRDRIYGLKKKEIVAEPEAEGRVGRRKKTPAELAAENNPNDSDDEEFATGQLARRESNAWNFLDIKVTHTKATKS
ncbi:hypothetical protein C0Q70_09779 [Pomacea canaliculata]|uniref:Uncharacterized protein n=1 Tax=Pomacea canaliculata TaxID=400727 RepID=A0A2T7PAT4_POMCA|nr:hypothetical protein C0Q70_09779 [Pomacea canaliculata]